MIRIYYISLRLRIMQEDILDKAKNYGHEHLVEHYHSLEDKTMKEDFLNQLKNIDYEQCQQLYKDVYLATKNKNQVRHTIT